MTSESPVVDEAWLQLRSAGLALGMRALWSNPVFQMDTIVFLCREMD